MKLFLSAVLAVGIWLPSQIFAQCPVKKTAKFYGFFRVTNFVDKVCWLSEPFGYDELNGEIKNYDELKACFIKKVTALGGNVEHAVDAFGKDRVVWLNNTYEPSPDLPSSYNWGLSSVASCLPFIKDEIKYKTGVGIEVKIVRMFGDGTISTDNVDNEITR